MYTVTVKFKNDSEDDFERILSAMYYTDAVTLTTVNQNEILTHHFENNEIVTFYGESESVRIDLANVKWIRIQKSNLNLDAL